MALTWTDYSNGETLVNIRTAENTFRNAVVTDVNANTTKLAGIEAGAEVNVNADWNATTGDSQIQNKPTLATVATSGNYNDLSNQPAIPAAVVSVTELQRDALTATQGMFIFNSTTTQFEGYDGTSWVILG